MGKLLRRPRAGVSSSHYVDRTVRQPDPPRESLAYSQTEARKQRRKGFGHLVHYTGFDVVAEVHDQVGPLASEIAELLSTGQSFLDPRANDVGQNLLWFPGLAVDQVAKAVLQTRADLVAAMAPLARGEARARLSTLVSDSDFKSPLAIDNDLLRTGYWVDGLVACVEPLAADLAALVVAQPAERVSLLDRAISDALRGSEGWGFDYRVRQISEEAIPRLRRAQQVHRRHAAEEAETTAVAEAARTREALRQFGLS